MQTRTGMAATFAVGAAVVTAAKESEELKTGPELAKILQDKWDHDNMAVLQKLEKTLGIAVRHLTKSHELSCTVTFCSDTDCNRRQFFRALAIFEDRYHFLLHFTCKDRHYSPYSGPQGFSVLSVQVSIPSNFLQCRSDNLVVIDDGLGLKVTRVLFDRDRHFQ